MLSEFSARHYLGIVSATVFAVGFNDDYIFVKQHPRKFGMRPDFKKTNYYIVLRELEFGKNQYQEPYTVLGPFSITEFTQVCERLKISKAIFSREFSGLR